jgi:hypothetical protein
MINTARICERYHCLPSAVRAEKASDIEALLRIIELDAENKNIKI